jgi:hypothetical protein
LGTKSDDHSPLSAAFPHSHTNSKYGAMAVFL